MLSDKHPEHQKRLGHRFRARCPCFGLVFSGGSDCKKKSCTQPAWRRMAANGGRGGIRLGVRGRGYCSLALPPGAAAEHPSCGWITGAGPGSRRIRHTRGRQHAALHLHVARSARGRSAGRRTTSLELNAVTPAKPEDRAGRVWQKGCAAPCVAERANAVRRRDLYIASETPRDRPAHSLP